MSMTKEELIEALQRLPDGMEVKFIFPSGDYWGNQKAGSIDFVDTVDVTFSDYHRQDCVYDNEQRHRDEEEEYDDDEERPTIKTIIGLALWDPR